MSTMQFTGFVGSEPEVKTVRDSNLLSISVAFSTGRDDQTVWIEVACWGPMGERLTGKVKKGDFVFCTGTIRKVSAYQKKSGDIGQSIQVTGAYVRVLEKDSSGGDRGGSNGNKTPTAPGGGWGGGKSNGGGGWGNTSNGSDPVPF